MKVCPKCGTANSDMSVMCKDCGAHISAEAETVRSTMEKIEEAERQRRKKIMLLHKIFVPIAAVAYVVCYVLHVMSIARTSHGAGGMLGFYMADFFLVVVLPIVSWLGIHKPEAMFKMSHFASISNIDDVVLSDWHLYGNKIGGILALVFSYVYLLLPLFMEWREQAIYAGQIVVGG